MARPGLWTLLAWLLAYPLVAAGFCFALAAASVTVGEVSVAVFAPVVGAFVGWEAAGKGFDDRTCGVWSMAAVVLALAFCIAGVATADETLSRG